MTVSEGRVLDICVRVYVFSFAARVAVWATSSCECSLTSSDSFLPLPLSHVAFLIGRIAPPAWNQLTTRIKIPMTGQFHPALAPDESFPSALLAHAKQTVPHGLYIIPD